MMANGRPQGRHLLDSRFQGNDGLFRVLLWEGKNPGSLTSCRFPFPLRHSRERWNPGLRLRAPLVCTPIKTIPLDSDSTIMTPIHCR